MTLYLPPLRLPHAYAIENQGLASAAHKPTFFDLMLEQLVVPLVTVTV